MQHCQCDTGLMADTVLPTESFQLCHHSPPQHIARAKARYEDLLSRLAAGLDPFSMVQLDLAEASIYYARQRLTPQQRNMMNEYERNIVHAGFLRVRATMTTYILLDKLHQISLMNPSASTETAAPAPDQVPGRTPDETPDDTPQPATEPPPQDPSETAPPDPPPAQDATTDPSAQGAEGDPAP